MGIPVMDFKHDHVQFISSILITRSPLPGKKPRDPRDIPLRSTSVPSAWHCRLDLFSSIFPLVPAAQKMDGHVER
jgi:hypothetical protein